MTGGQCPKQSVLSERERHEEQRKSPGDKTGGRPIR